MVASRLIKPIMVTTSNQHFSVTRKLGFGNFCGQFNGIESNRAPEEGRRVLWRIAGGKCKMQVRDAILRMIDIPDDPRCADVCLANPCRMHGNLPAGYHRA